LGARLCAWPVGTGRPEERAADCRASRPGEEVWLVGAWRSSGERKYYLSNLPPGTSRRRLAATIKARWVCEQAHQQLKQELGLGAFEGRSWTGLHRHALMSCIAFAYLQHLRLRAAAARGKRRSPQRHPRSQHALKSAAPSSPAGSRHQSHPADARTAARDCGPQSNKLPK
jgi:hypothetical protein